MGIIVSLDFARALTSLSRQPYHTLLLLCISVAARAESYSVIFLHIFFAPFVYINKTELFHRREKSIEIFCNVEKLKKGRKNILSHGSNENRSVCCFFHKVFFFENASVWKYICLRRKCGLHILSKHQSNLNQFSVTGGSKN